MAGRRGAPRVGRFNNNYVNNSVRGRGEGQNQGAPLFSSSRGVSQEREGGFSSGFGLGFGLTNEEGGDRDCGEGGQGSTSTDRRGRGLPNNHRQRSLVAEASFNPSGVRGTRFARGRGGQVAAAALAQGRGIGRPTFGAPGGNSYVTGCPGVDASQSAPTPSTAIGAANSPRAGQSGTSSRATSDQDDTTDEGTEVPRNFEGHQTDKSGKGKNFQPEEERQLARSVIKISQDPITGNGQKGSAFWERISKHYNERRPFLSRPTRSLETKWGVIKHDVAKYIGVLQQCTNLNISGISAADLQKKALDLYRLKTPKHAEFVYLHVWLIVKDVPWWNVGCTQEKTSIAGMKRKDVPCDSDSTFLPPSSSTNGGDGSPSTFIRPRPQGSKHAKEARRITSVRESAAIAQAKATKAMADATLKKTEIMADQNLFMLMSHSPDAVVSEAAAKYFKLRQEEELEKLETRLAEVRAKKTQVRSTPPPIPVETTEALQHRLATAFRTSPRSHAPQRQARPLDEDAGLPRRGSHVDIKDPLAQHNDFGVDGSTAATADDNAQGLHDFENEEAHEFEPFICSQHDIHMGFDGFVPSTQDALAGRHRQQEEDLEALDSDGAATRVGGDHDLREREMLNDTEEEDNEDTCFPRNDYGSRGIELGDYEDSQECHSLDHASFDLNTECS